MVDRHALKLDNEYKESSVGWKNKIQQLIIEDSYRLCNTYDRSYVVAVLLILIN